MPPRRRAFAPGMAAGRREENYFSAPQGQNPPQNRQNPRNRNENPHRQSRPAASRIAGASNRSRQPTGAPRPAAAAAPSPPKSLRGQVDCRCFQQKQAADQGLPSPVPRGKVQEGVPPSWFPAQAGKNPDHFSRRHVRREKYSSRSEVSGPPWRARRPSGVPSPPAERRGWLVEMAPPFPRNASRSEVWLQGRLWATLQPHPSAVLCHRLSARRALRRGPSLIKIAKRF